MPILEIEDLNTYYGSIHALKGITLSVNEGEIVTLIGANGAGKTTFFNCIAGFYHPEEGKILFGGKPIHGLRRDQIAHLGIARTYQNIRLFANMTALENILVGQHHQLHASWIGAIANNASVRTEEAAAVDPALP